VREAICCMVSASCKNGRTAEGRLPAITVTAGASRTARWREGRQDSGYTSRLPQGFLFVGGSGEQTGAGTVGRRRCAGRGFQITSRHLEGRRLSPPRLSCARKAKGGQGGRPHARQQAACGTGQPRARTPGRLTNRMDALPSCAARFAICLRYRRRAWLL